VGKCVLCAKLTILIVNYPVKIGEKTRRRAVSGLEKGQVIERWTPLGERGLQASRSKRVVLLVLEQRSSLSIFLVYTLCPHFPSSDIWREDLP